MLAVNVLKGKVPPQRQMAAVMQHTKFNPYVPGLFWKSHFFVAWIFLQESTYLRIPQIAIK
jgi:hypothetical protein